MASSAGTVTILFTDLVSSTELLERAGDEEAQRIFQSHHKLLRDAVSAHGGHEVKWLGDGLMVAFPSAADAVRCAVAMQQAARRPAAGERLQIRAGLNVGEALQDEADYFGTAVVVAKRLCDSAEAGQIVCSSLVAALLTGRQAFRFRDLGDRTLKGLSQPVAACEVTYDRDEPGILLAHTPFVGRSEEVAQLGRRLDETRAGRGGLVMLVGEPGIGKTRTSEEFAEAARIGGATVIWGSCYEGEWAPPYGAFAEAITQYCRAAEPDALSQDLGLGAGPISRLIPALHERLSDLAEPVSLQPDEERFRLLDAVAQLFIAASARAPLVVVLDDLHWADKGTIAMLRHVARFAPRQRLLLIGAYRDVELDRQHPLADALSALRREVEYERIVLKGLNRDDVGRLLATLAEHEVPDGLVAAISRETDGNPFFIRETLLHLIDTGAIYRREGAWTSNATSIEDLGIPEGVRQVIGRRLSRLSESANRLLTGASAFSGAFSFEIVRRVAGLDEGVALDALDETLEAQLLRPGIDADRYQFTHALIRHTLYGELNPSRQVRLHRQIAEAMENTGDTSKHAAELAYQYHRSAVLPGAERGAGYAIVAADRADAAYAHEETAAFLHMALDLVPEDDARRARLLARLGLSLAWTLHFEEAEKAATEAGDRIAQTEGADAAADYIEAAATALFNAGYPRGAWALAEQGLRYNGAKRDMTWASLKTMDIMRDEASDPDNLGIPLDTPERREAEEIIGDLPFEERPGFLAYFSSRADLLARYPNDPAALAFYIGDYRRSGDLFQQLAQQAEREGRLAWAAAGWAQTARLANALGNFEAADEAYGRAVSLAARLAGPSVQALQLVGARWEMRYAKAEGVDAARSEVEGLMQLAALEDQWAFAAIRAAGAMIYAWFGRLEDALKCLEELKPAIERAPLWAPNYPLLPCLAASALWLLDRTDHIAVIERNLLEKVVKPDLRYPMYDGRLSMAQLSALQGRHAEAIGWFAKAREVLDEQGARPLRAIVDLDEALMYQRRATPGDPELATHLQDAALQQFRELGMTGWISRAEDLRRS